jgi:flagellar biosynthesis protein FlhG
MARPHRRSPIWHRRKAKVGNVKKVVTDQADGLRRLMAGNPGRLVAVLGSDFADVESVVMNLTAALVQQGQDVLLLDERKGRQVIPVQRQGKLVLVHAVLDVDGALSPLAAQAEHVVVVLRANASAIKASYVCIKKLHHAHALQRVRVLVNGVTDAAEAQRILANLAHTGSRYLSLALEPAGWVRSDPLLTQAQRLNLAVVEAFKSSPAAVDFRQIAADLLQWPLAHSRPPSETANAPACHDARLVLAVH